ncbi:unnamed protein product, partial [Arabidopsis halleri]
LKLKKFTNTNGQILCLLEGHHALQNRLACAGYLWHCRSIKLIYMFDGFLRFKKKQTANLDLTS